MPDLAARFYGPDFDVRIVNGPGGFRVAGARVLPDADAECVVVLGDSFTWGWGVAQGEIFTDHLQDLLVVLDRVLCVPALHVGLRQAVTGIGREGIGLDVPQEDRDGFRELVDGKHDDVPEQAFLYMGTIEEVLENAERIRKESEAA